MIVSATDTKLHLQPLCTIYKKVNKWKHTALILCDIHWFEIFFFGYKHRTNTQTAGSRDLSLSERSRGTVRATGDFNGTTLYLREGCSLSCSSCALSKHHCSWVKQSGCRSSGELFFPPKARTSLWKQTVWMNFLKFKHLLDKRAASAGSTLVHQMDIRLNSFLTTDAIRRYLGAYNWRMTHFCFSFSDQ